MGGDDGSRIGLWGYGMNVVATILLLLALAGTGYTLFAAWLVGRLGAQAGAPPVVAEAVSLLKPLHGAEPRLAGNLASFLDQDWDAPIEMVCGVQRGDDPAIGVVEGVADANRPSPDASPSTPFVLSEVEARAGSATPGARPSTSLRTNGLGEGPGAGAGAGTHHVRLVIDPARHGANAKIANLRNMFPAASHDLLVLSDSDMAVPRDYLATIAATLARPGVGAVSCLYRGRGDAGFWSVLAAAGSSYQFLPSVLVGIALGQGDPCMGSTIALRRDTLARIGGLAAFADVLADDHAIGEAVRGLGLAVAIPPMILVHAAGERSLGEVVRHELRWAATVRGLVPGAAYAGSITTFPLALAMLALPIAPVAGGRDRARRAGRAVVSRRADRSRLRRAHRAFVAVAGARYPVLRRVRRVFRRPLG